MGNDFLFIFIMKKSTSFKKESMDLYLMTLYSVNNLLSITFSVANNGLLLPARQLSEYPLLIDQDWKGGESMQNCKK